MITPVRYATILLTLLLLGACSPGPPPSEERAALEQAFEESMRGVVMDGHFTLAPLDGGEAAAAEDGESVRLRGDRYEIEKVAKVAGDLWTFHARIQFGEKDVTLPVPVNVVWAEDTPVIGVTDLGLPGLGTYTARVVIYRDAYAGTWSGGTHGGSMFGRILRPD